MSAVDLFTWREIADASARVVEAEALRVAAERARRYAPHGEIRARQIRLEEATRAALAAEVELQRLQARAGEL